MSNLGVPVASSRVVLRKDRNPPKPFPYEPVNKQDGKFYYGVDILTGNQPGAETVDSGVYFSLTGSKRSSDRIRFNFFGGKKESHEYVVVESDEDLGGVLVVELGNEKYLMLDAADSWYVDQTTVFLFENETKLVFPCYHWIGNGDSVTITAKTTTLKDIVSSPVLQKQRSDQLERQKQRYQWKAFSNEKLPSGMDSAVSDLPVDEQFEKVKSINFNITDPAKAIIVLGLTAVMVDIKGLNDYAIFANALANDEQKEAVRSLRWVSDVEFGRQILNGVNPVVIRKCSTLPDNFPVTNDMVKGLMTRGKTLSEEMQAGYVYICDLKIMDGLTTRDGCYNVAPLLLLYVNNSNQLVPIAIQLQQQPGDNNPIFLPTDHWLDWLLAKIYYRLAHGQHHQLSTHYLSSHAAMGVYSVATRRNLPDCHPIFKLLVPHFRYTIAINTRAVETLINDGGPIDVSFSIGGQGKTELLRRAGKAYNVHWTNLKENISERGVDNADLLPGYYYRDDNLKIWNAMETYVRGIVDLFYSSDNDVQEDKEIQEWANDIHTLGFPAYGGVLGHGFPKTITSKQELVKYCTVISFTGSGQHSSINFGQFDEYSFAPNAPFAMRQPPPTEKGKVTVQQVLDSLPDKNTILVDLALVNQLSQYSNDEVYLREFPNQRFPDHESAVSSLVKTFQEEMDAISKQIKERNKGLDVPYTYCLPERVTKSITI